MIREALEYVDENAAERVKAELRLAHVPGLAPGKLAYFVYGGASGATWTPRLFDYPRGPKEVRVESVAQLHAYVGDQTSVIFVDRKTGVVTAFLAKPGDMAPGFEPPAKEVVGDTALHDYVELDRVVCELTETHAWAALNAGIEGTPEQIINLQKLHFSGWNYDARKEGVEAFDKFCQKRMKRVVMSVKKTVNSSTAVGTDSMGTDVTREALGGEDGANWPDYVLATAKVYERVNYDAHVRLMLSFNHAKNALVLTPVPDDVEEQETQVIEVIEKALGGPQRRIFRGAPVLTAGGAVRLD